MKFAAVIVETRQLDNLSEIIKNHLKFLPNYTQLIVYHGLNNKHLISNLNAIFYTIHSDNLDNHSYNELLTSSEFWEPLCYYDKVLIFQTDSMILRGGIEEFFNDNADYYGAPWKFQSHGGNGGFSLRNPKIMLEICEKYGKQYDKSKHGNEDIFFCNIMKNENIGKLGSREMCEKFSCEAIFKLGSWAIHAIEKWHSDEKINLILNQYKI